MAPQRSPQEIRASIETNRMELAIEEAQRIRETVQGD